jgi:hypothetical protein
LCETRKVHCWSSWNASWGFLRTFFMHGIHVSRLVECQLKVTHSGWPNTC